MIKRNKCRDEDFKRLQRYTLASIKCKNCGHTILPGKDRGICTHCGYYVYKNDKIEFKYKLKNVLKKY